MITFYGNVSEVTHGGDGSRLTLTVRDAPADLGAAIGLMPLKNRVLSVRAWLGSGEEQVAEFLASIAPIMTALSFRPGNVRVKLDVPESDVLASARLLARQDSVLRFEIADEGEREANKKPSKGDHGMFWNYLCKRGFLSHPDLSEILDRLRRAHNRPDGYDAVQLLYDCFGVTSRAAISPQALREWLRVQHLPEQSSAWTMIEQAERGGR